MACTPPRCRREQSEGPRTPGVAPPVNLHCPFGASGQWHQGVPHFSDNLLGQFVELDGTFGQDLTPGFLREFLGNHSWCPGEETVGMRIIGGPENLVRAKVLRQIRQAAFDWLETDPTVPFEILTGPHTQRRVIEDSLILEGTF